MITLSVLVGVVAAVSGYALAIVLDASIAGAMATTAGICFALAALFAPQHGMVARVVRRARQRRQFATEMLVVHLAHHEGTDAQALESEVSHLQNELRWNADYAMEVVKRAQHFGFIQAHGKELQLTEQGRQLAEQVTAR
jgi:manganese/zinc/iron transport system permease protein